MKRLQWMEFIMPRGPQGQKRPADSVARAVMVARIAVGEIADDESPVARQNVGVAGAIARAKARTPARRKEIAKASAEARWS